MKPGPTIVLLIFILSGVKAYGQHGRFFDTVEVHTRKLELNFQYIQSKGKTIDFKKFKQLESLIIHHYTEKSGIKFRHLEKTRLSNIWLNFSDEDYFLKQLSKSIDLKCLHIWKNYDDNTPLKVPARIYNFPNLVCFTIGCCNQIDFNGIDFARFHQLDTLILEAPFTDVRPFVNVKNISFLGYWPVLKDSIQKLIDSTFQTTQKEEYCFPPHQPVQLFNGTNKPFDQLKTGDTLQGLDTLTRQVKPCIVSKIIVHPKSYCAFTNLYLDYVYADINKRPNTTSTSITVTDNHPIYTSHLKTICSGQVTLQTPLEGHVKNVLIRLYPNRITKTYRESESYNIITTSGNFFVEGVLFKVK